MKNTSIAVAIALSILLPNSSFVAAQDSGLSPAGAAPKSSEITAEAVIEITKNRTIKGQLSNFDNLKVETNFGEATFSMSEMEAIKFGLDDNGSCLFVFKNGDLVTAKLQLESIQVQTDWGNANIKPDKVVSIRMNENGNFYSETKADGTKRWKYGNARPVNPGTILQNSTPSIFGNQ